MTDAILDDAHAACNRIAPLWTLDAFVAVNPFLGLSDHALPDAAARMAAVAGARLTRPRADILARIDAGEITAADLVQALAETGAAKTPEALLAAAREPAPQATPIATVTDTAGALDGRDWTGFLTARLSVWAAERFDAGQAQWPDPQRDLPAFAHWRQSALSDATPELAGLKGFRPALAALPDTGEGIILAAPGLLGLPAAARELYFHRLLMGLPGWAGFARHLSWKAAQKGKTDDALTGLLAIRLAQDLALHRIFADRPGFTDAWAQAVQAIKTPDANAFAIDATLQAAAEAAYRRNLVARLQEAPGKTPDTRPRLQAAFCIDVRSEPFRRALEAQASGIETLGVAGFFGLPLARFAAGDPVPTAQCPVLLAPALDVDADAAARPRARDTRHFGGILKGFRSGGVSCFGFVETLGLAHAGRMLRDALARPAQPTAKPAPELAHIAPEARADLAAGILRAMSLTERFAPVVLIAGHGATSTNNPHARGLDCGACGGQPGDVNAQVLCGLLNDPRTRDGLAARGIAIPGDTRFAPALHDTTTDRVTLLGHEGLDAATLSEIRTWLDAAGALCRTERGGNATDAFERALHWAETRPEWGLAGCAAFIAAPRSRTAGARLDGRAFLHDYDWHQDRGFATLETILTAPVVVASWIALQYYGSAVDNRIFGAGDKTLHDVVGGIAVREGAEGDIRPGLPIQSLHDGSRLVHEPLRLTVMAEAPADAIAAIVARHPDLQRLVGNGWIALFAMDAEGRMTQRITANGTAPAQLAA
ncbi:DUF2309 domain-containing protein [Halovulum dunhuangense]|uniref:Probable inorganic carbon transporter subunit DabA n=1 Tax=Halovulum dunhuangense TaxID=1505036 RepID=A0A849KVK5_9RHOB|nr:DUF2309 domain-containing protein [Halovulum dunhuangense]NNU79438.1 DUF2309 domain-containing protein [Halovulum dunhuangense]